MSGAAANRIVREEEAVCSSDVATEGRSQKALDVLIKTCDEFVALEHRNAVSPVAILHATAASLHSFASAAAQCEEAGLDRESVLPYLDGVRALHSQSPFVKRLQTWPRGYPGDFETVEYLCEAKNHAPAGTVPWAIEEYALHSSIAQQHRNKVGLQARAMLSAITANPRARIASLGCGGCRDLSLIQDYIEPTQATFVLVDADAEALSFAQRRLPRLEGQCRLVHGRVPRVISRVAWSCPFDLVVAGGLFDYLPDRWAISTLQAIKSILGPRGRLLLSNVATGNPFRPWLEYLAEWHLIERSESDLGRLLNAAGFGPEHCHVTRETSHLAFMVDAYAD